MKITNLQALRVRIPTHAPGRSPAALASPSLRWTVTALLGVAAGRPAPDPVEVQD